MALVVPQKTLIVPEPELIEGYGIPEFYVDGSTQVIDDDVVHSIAWVEHAAGDHVERHTVLRLHWSLKRYTVNAVARYRYLQSRPH